MDKESWSVVDLARVRAASGAAAREEVSGVVLNATDAYVCVVTRARTMVHAHVECHMPRKGQGGEDERMRAKASFYDRCVDALARHADADRARAILFAGPGQWKTELMAHVREVAGRADAGGGKPAAHMASVVQLARHHGKFLAVDVADVNRESFAEAVSRRAVVERVGSGAGGGGADGDDGVGAERRLLDEWRELWRADTGRVAYGARTVS